VRDDRRAQCDLSGIALPLAMYLLLSLVRGRIALSRTARALVVLSIGVAVEILQYFGVPLFGRTFDPVDFVMYGVGVVAGVLLELIVLSMLDAKSASQLA